MLKIKYCIPILALVIATKAARLPTYLDQCKENDPNINECFIKKANLGIKQVVKGDVHYDIPCMTPLTYPGPIIKKDMGMTIVLSDIKIIGLENTTVSEADLNFANRTASMVLKNPKLIILSKYEINGHLFNFPIWSSGHANKAIEGLTLTYNIAFNTNIVDDESYFVILSHNVEHEIERGDLNLGNYFDDDYFVGRQLNVLFNARIKELDESTKKSINNNISEFLTKLFTGLVSKVPVSEFFKP